MSDPKQKYIEELSHAAVKLGMITVQEIAQKSLAKKRNLPLRSFMKVLDDYILEHDKKSSS